MQRYFATIKDNKVKLDDGDVHHLLHVVRAYVGDEIEVVYNKHLYLAQVISVNHLDIQVKQELQVSSELPNNVTLFFALAKGDKIDLVIQKATELGASRVVLVKTERCVTKFDDKDVEHKIERFQKIAKEASEQSHRLVIPEIYGVVDLKKIPSQYLCENNYVAYEKVAGDTTELYDEISSLNGKSVSIMIGPEGGFSEGEIAYLTKALNFKTVSLGKRILRTETAAIYALSVIGFILEK